MKNLRMIIAIVIVTLGGQFGSASGQMLTTLYSFNSNSGDGYLPLAGLVQGTNGNFYGTASQGGQAQTPVGTVFEISSSGAFNGGFLSAFGNGNNGANPYAGLVLGSDGNFYGTTYYGGTSSSGTVFRISPEVGGVITILHSFNGDFSGSDGANPAAGLVQGTDGNFYGTTSQGGAHNTGTVFRISPGGSFSNLYSFSGPDGANPVAGLVQGSDGNFYGTTSHGGACPDCGDNGCGTVFRISPGGTFSNLHSFGVGDGGLCTPLAGLIQGSDGNFYGTTATLVNDNSAVFRISPSGSATNLHQFNGPDGVDSVAGLVRGSDGNFYGTTIFGGTNTCSCGTVFRISPSGSFSSLHSFNGSDGVYPQAGLVQGIDGRFYGTTSNGGASTNCPLGCGTMFALSVPLNPPANQIAKIQTFSIFGGMDVAIQIPTVVGETYQLQYSSSMNPTNWIDTGGTITGIGGPMTLFDSIGVLPPQRFYQAVISISP